MPQGSVQQAIFNRSASFEKNGGVFKYIAFIVTLLMRTTPETGTQAPCRPGLVSA